MAFAACATSSKNNLLSSSLMSTISLTWSLYATMHLPGWLCSYLPACGACLLRLYSYSGNTGWYQLQCDVDQLMNILRGVIQHQLRREIQFPHQLFGLDKFSYGKTHMAVRSHYNRLTILHASL